MYISLWKVGLVNWRVVFQAQDSIDDSCSSFIFMMWVEITAFLFCWRHEKSSAIRDRIFLAVVDELLVTTTSTTYFWICFLSSADDYYQESTTFVDILHVWMLRTQTDPSFEKCCWVVFMLELLHLGAHLYPLKGRIKHQTVLL